MKTWLICLLMCWTTNVLAIDFSNQKGLDLSGGGLFGKTVETVDAGSTSKKGFRIETSVMIKGYDVGAIGIDLEAPLFNGTKIQVRALTGMSSDPFDFDATRFKFGMEFEYELKRNQSIVVDITNNYDPFAKAFGSRPTITAGFRFHF